MPAGRAVVYMYFIWNANIIIIIEIDDPIFIRLQLFVPFLIFTVSSFGSASGSTSCLLLCRSMCNRNRREV